MIFVGMKKQLDNFSRQADLYKKYRPEYPEELFLFILKHVKEENKAWDCGTGNGQVANVLSDYFKEVYATDLSEKQIQQAERVKNVYYRVQRAEERTFEENSFDLIRSHKLFTGLILMLFIKKFKGPPNPGV